MPEKAKLKHLSGNYRTSRSAAAKFWLFRVKTTFRLPCQYSLNALASMNQCLSGYKYSYIHYSYLPMPVVFFVSICFSVLQSDKATRTWRSFLTKVIRKKLKGRVRKSGVRREGFHLDSQQYSNFQRQNTQTRSVTVSRTPLYVTITLLHCL